MTVPRSYSWAKPTIRIAAAGLGAAIAGPLGGALGGWLVEALGESAVELLKTYTEHFGEKAAEKLLDTAADSLAETLKEPSIGLQDVYRETLRLSLAEIHRQIRLDGYDDWFINWECSLAPPLKFSPIEPDQAKNLDLFRLTMERLDAQGQAMREKSSSLWLEPRAMPDTLLSELTNRLPDHLQGNFRNLIARPENEQAWKQMQILFQGFVRAKLIDIGEGVEPIPQIADDTGIIRGILERPLIQNVPALRIKLHEPASLSWAIPAARDIDKDWKEGLFAEIALYGMPDPEWFSKVVPLEQAECFEAYRKEVHSWYTLTTVALKTRHEYETHIARSMFFIFEVSNEGRAPAENVAVRLELPVGLSVDKNPGEGWLFPSVPVPPASLGLQVRGGSRSYHSQHSPLYPGWGPPQPSLQSWTNEEFWQTERDDKEKQVFQATLADLEHGTSQRMRPLRLSFEYEPVHDLVIRYKLHASNQPEDTIDTIGIEVREIPAGAGQVS
jgi:plasmid stabilization system protein ParE